PQLTEPLADALLRPHRCYFRSLYPLLQPSNLQPPISNFQIAVLAHITGGGLLDNIPRILPENTSVQLNRGSWPIPPIFQLIQKEAQADEKAMFRTFNMGIGMVAIIPAPQAHAITAALEEAGEQVYEIGQVISGSRGVILV